MNRSIAISLVTVVLASVAGLTAGCESDTEGGAAGSSAMSTTVSPGGSTNVQDAARTALRAGVQEVRVSFDSPSTTWRASGRIDLGAAEYRLVARSGRTRPAFTPDRGNGVLAVYGDRLGTSIGSLGLPRNCFVDAHDPAGSYGGVLSVESAMSLAQSYLRRLAGRRPFAEEGPDARRRLAAAGKPAVAVGPSGLRRITIPLAPLPSEGPLQGREFMRSLRERSTLTLVFAESPAGALIPKPPCMAIE